MDDDRRKGKRHPVKMPVKLRPREGVTPYSHSAESINISESGLLFMLEQPVAVGSHVDLSFVMPGEVTGGMSMKIRCTARVVRVDTYDNEPGRSGIAAHIERFETIVAEESS